VTAACIAIGREKFEAVGGFDAENLPVDLNDMDLCLRVSEHGWTNLWTPDAVLVHTSPGPAVSVPIHSCSIGKNGAISCGAGQSCSPMRWRCRDVVGAQSLIPKSCGQDHAQN
jgi:hypothetical protein